MTVSARRRPPRVSPGAALFCSVLAASPLPLAGCGGEEPAVAPAAPGGNAAAAPAPAPRPKPSSSRRNRAPRRPKPAVALPIDAARYAAVSAGEEPTGERANFRLAGSALPAGGARVRVAAAGAGGRFGVSATPSGSNGSNASIELPAGFRAARSAGAGPGGLPMRIVCEADDMPLALVPAGVVRMRGGESAEPRSVFVSDFYMDRHEVTVGQFRRFLASPDGRAQDPPANADAPESHPAVGVPWRAAFLYAKWCGRSLPTEAEWERAARGDADLPTPWGAGRPVFAGGREPGDVGPVAAYRTDRSPFGVYDLAGNAPEWTHQTYYDDPLSRDRPDAAGLYRDPDGGMSPGGEKTVKGLGDGWDTGRRAAVDTTDTAAGVGFRCVWRPTEGGEPGGDPLFAGGGR